MVFRLCCGSSGHLEVWKVSGINAKDRGGEVRSTATALSEGLHRYQVQLAPDWFWNVSEG